MHITSRFIGTVATAAATATTAVIIAGCAPPATSAVPNDRPARAGAPYGGDPWEARARNDFWTGQHIHDSWNRCHIGENAPPAPGC